MSLDQTPFFFILLFSRYCQSHLQVLGLVPKKIKKVKKPGEFPEGTPCSSPMEEYPHEKHKKAKDKKKKKKKDKDRDKHKHSKGKSKSKKHNHISQLLNSSEPVNLDALSLLIHQQQNSPSNGPSHTNFDSTDGKLITKQNGGDRSRTNKSKSDKGSLLQDRLQHKLEKNKQRIRMQRDKEIEARTAQARLLSSPTRHSPTPTPMQPSFSGLLSSLLHHSSLYSGYQLPVMPSTSSGVPHSHHAQLSGFPSMPFHLPSAHVPASATVVLTNTRKPRELYKQKLKIPHVDHLREAWQEEEKKKIDLFPLGKSIWKLIIF